MNTARKEAAKTIAKLEKEIGRRRVQRENQLLTTLQRLESYLGTLKHDLRSRGGLHGTVHPSGVIELACGVHCLVREMKIKEDLIELVQKIK